MPSPAKPTDSGSGAGSGNKTFYKKSSQNPSDPRRRTLFSICQSDSGPGKPVSRRSTRSKRRITGNPLYCICRGLWSPVFAETISSFQKKYPHVQYNLWNGNSDDVNARVSKGLCEIAMITAPYNKEGFEVLPVHQEPWVAIFPHDHPLANNADKPLTPEELLPYELLIPSRESRKSEIDRWFSHTGKAPVIRGRIAHMMNAYELSRHGVGVAIYPASISHMIKNNEICIRQIDHPDAFASYALIWLRNHQLSRTAEIFIEHVKHQSLKPSHTGLPG